MKKRIPLIMQLFALVIITACSCVNPKQNNTSGAGCYKGKLVISGICRQKVVVLISANTGNLAIDTAWQNPDNQQIYKNAFSVKNVCDFPESIKVGDTFDFKIIPAQKTECSVCMAYIPVPSSQLIIETGCK